ncbi:putative amidophosphoribosyltransferase [Geomicrobium halophilum]|uniref:Putative amidophosphoribosyltransferase n=1 Tax=Geomicrobium halophilum TaxID=549000 RepID=A0A841PQM7_9BACL|nr:hypothetical protein [Geomicrobium halophilum]MBB6449486.1 putative amidophosphoribosyltransferase [Geomicrobium halophilum]
MVHCPNCHFKDLGKIGSSQYYCWRCCLEVDVQGEVMSVFQVEEDGSLSSLDDLFSSEERQLQDSGLIPKASG